MPLFKLKNKSMEHTVPTDAYRCLVGEQLTQQQGVGHLLMQIRSLISVTNEIYADLYLKTLHGVAEFCQAMPVNEANKPYSLLTQQLERCVDVLQTRRGLMLPKNASAETMAEQEPLWTYALFSVGLLYQLYTVQEDRQIIMCDVQGGRKRVWHPLCGTLYEPHTYFKIEWKPSTGQISNTTLMATLAARLINPQTLGWLAQEHSLLQVWWDAITTQDSKNPLINIIQKDGNLTTSQEKPHPQNVTQNLKNATPQEQQSNEPLPGPDNDLKTEAITESFLKFIEDNYFHNNTKNKWIRVEGGLLVSLQSVDDFLQAHQALCKDKNQFIENIKPALIEINNQHHFCFRPLAYDDRRIIEGFVFKEALLNAQWKSIPIDSVFHLEAKLGEPPCKHKLKQQ